MYMYVYVYVYACIYTNILIFIHPPPRTHWHGDLYGPIYLKYTFLHIHMLRILLKDTSVT